MPEDYVTLGFADLKGHIVTINWQAPLSPRELDLLLSEPPDHPMNWGYYLRLDLGLGYFQWFPDRAYLLQSLTQVEILHAPSVVPDRQSYVELRDQLFAFAQDWESSHIITSQLIAAVNPLLPECELLWLGQISELLNGTEDFALALRQNFGHPAQISEINDAFKVFIEEYDA